MRGYLLRPFFKMWFPSGSVRFCESFRLILVTKLVLQLLQGFNLINEVYSNIELDGSMCEDHSLKRYSTIGMGAKPPERKILG